MSEKDAAKPVDPTAKWKTLAVLGILAVVGIGLITNQSFESAPHAQTAPDVVFLDHSGKQVRLADYRGKIVLMNFWATWCPPCVEETPSFDRLAARLKKDHSDVAIIAASLDDDGWAAIDPFVAKMHVNDLPVVLDATPSGGGRMEIGAQAAKFKTFKLPETWVISRDGRILKRFIGAQDWDDPQLIPYLEGLDRGAS